MEKKKMKASNHTCPNANSQHQSKTPCGLQKENVKKK